MLLVKNVKVIDGTGKPAYPADVLIVGNKISAIGSFPHKQADEIIEGLGGYLTPGFIDINTDADHHLTLFTNPAQENFLLQGVTTIIGGNCGSSLAPLLYGNLESIRKWADINQVNINWQTIEEFLEVIKKLPLGVNFGTLIGHSTIRRSLIGEDQRDLTDKELKVFKLIIKESLEAGAFGLSTGLSYIHARQAPYKEIQELVSVLGKYNAVYATHLRDEKENIFNSVTETIKIYKDTGVKTVISHFRPIKKFEKEYMSAFNLIVKSSQTMDFHFDIYPFDTSIVPIYTLLPIWCQKGNLEQMLNYIKSPSIAKKIVTEIAKFKKGDLVIAQAIGQPILTGKVVSTAKELMEIMLETKLKALVFYKNIDYPTVMEVIFSDKALIASNSGGLGERSIKTFTKFLKLSSERPNYSIETAINKITAKPAEKFNIKSRGIIKEGFFADLVLLLNNTVQYVIVNGKLSVHKGEYRQTPAGQALANL